MALRRRLDSWVNRRDTRRRALKDALRKVVWERGEDAIVLSIGGGPDRWGDHITNVNIDRFPNVDVVGDAYALPYADGSVGAILHWAVIEHLEFPERAIAEMHRVLRPGGLALLNTPFLQAFHAHPNHIQNLTLIGQNRMLERGRLHDQIQRHLRRNLRPDRPLLGLPAQLPARPTAPRPRRPTTATACRLHRATRPATGRAPQRTLHRRQRHQPRPATLTPLRRVTRKPALPQ